MKIATQAVESCQPIQADVSANSRQFIRFASHDDSSMQMVIIARNHKEQVHMKEVPIQVYSLVLTVE